MVFALGPTTETPLPRLEYFTASLGCAVDQLSGRVSLFDILIEVTPQVLPAAFPRLVTVASFILDQSDMGVDFQFVVRTTTPGGVAGPHARLNFRGVDRHHNLINNWMGIPVVGDGTLVFEAFLNEVHVAQHEVTIHPVNASARFDGTLIRIEQPTQTPAE